MKKTILFDLDGTLLNTLEDLQTGVNLALRAYGCPEKSLDEVRMAVGNGIRKLIARVVPAGTNPETEEGIFARFKEEYQLHCADTTAPYPGVKELMQRLRVEGYLVAVVSNKADFAVQELMREYFPGLYDAALGEAAGTAKKPAPDMVEQVLRELCVEKEDAVYVGDSEVDVMTARNAGLPCICVTWGFREKSMLEACGGTCFAENAEELYERIIGK